MTAFGTEGIVQRLGLSIDSPAHELVRDAVSLVLSELSRSDDKLLADIRQFYFKPEPQYSLSELAALWRISEDDVRDIYSDELHRWLETNAHKGVGDFRVRWEDAVGATARFHLFRDYDVERALGDRFGRVRSETMRTVPVLIRVPLATLDVIGTQSFVLHGERTPARLIEGILTDATWNSNTEPVGDTASAKAGMVSLQRFLTANRIPSARIEELLRKRLRKPPSTTQMRRWRQERADIRRTRMVQILWALRVITNNAQLSIEQVFDFNPDNPLNWARDDDNAH